MTKKENFLACIRHQNPEWVPYGSECVITLRSPVEERPSSRSKPDAFGVPWSYDPSAEGGTYPTPGRHPVLEPENWESAVVFPALDGIDWDVPARESRSIDRDEHIVQGFVEMGIFERSYLLLGMENALMAFMTQKSAMIALAAAIADFKIDVIDRLDEAIDMDILWYGDDWGTQSNVFLPPDVWREIVRPQTQRIYDAAKKRGILVNQHSCGNVEPLIPDMVEMGADMWNPCQPVNDLAAIKRKYGSRLVLWGGIDSQFVLGRPGVTAEEVDEEVRLRIQTLATGGGYIASPSHSVPYPDYVQKAMERAVSRYGTEVYRRGPISRKGSPASDLSNERAN